MVILNAIRERRCGSLTYSLHSTECGPISTFLRSQYPGFFISVFFLFLDEFSVLGHAGDPGMDWEYFSLSGHIQPELLAHSDGTVELIIMVSLVDAIGIPV